MSTRQNQINAILATELVCGVIDEAVGNWTQCRSKDPDPETKKAFVDYATAVIVKILDAPTPTPNFATDWQEQISSSIYRMLNFKEFKDQQVPIIASALKRNFGAKTDDLNDGVWGYFMGKIANVVGCVTYMVANGLDPKLLELSREEANKQILERARDFAKIDPKQAIVIDPKVTSAIDAAIEIHRRIQQKKE